MQFVAVVALVVAADADVVAELKKILPLLTEFDSDYLESSYVQVHIIKAAQI